MKRITKLTPEIINKIISEERSVITKELEDRKRQEKIKLYEALKFLKKIKTKKSKTLKEQVILDTMTSKIVKKIKGRS